eukprot:TRINITY_DN14713_c0_g2_i1.p1 TRINITY_DN14713_c0_g2~~TRINITY_DN14713_c0_g2_i1.p1  ORF type:complete len:1032 (-),score=172.26 TRINITY_DN14713_c0_g2_i1:131-2794(-)
MADFVDDTQAAPGEKGIAALRRLAQQHQKELDEIKEDLDRRGDGGKSRFGQKLDEMERKYKEREEAIARGEIPADDAVDLDTLLEPESPRTRRKRMAGSSSFVVPDAKDPKLWCVKVFAPEKDLCTSLMNKARQEAAKGNPVPIYSAFCSKTLRGYIYIEAWKEAEIRAFARGIRGISPWGISLVPVAQMPHVFESALDTEKGEQVKAGDWVRMKRGPYKDDLGMVDEVREDGQYVVKMKPRIDFNIGKAMDRESRAKRCRPVARWFNKHDVEAARKLVNKEDRLSNGKLVSFYVVDDDAYRDGYLYKTAKTSFWAIGSEVKPQTYELDDWRNCPPPSEANRPQEEALEDEDAKLMPPPSMIPKREAPVDPVPFIEDDIVICNKGDLKNLVGKVVKAITGQITVLVEPYIAAPGLTKSNLSIACDRLCKYFEVGDYVKAVAGPNEGDAGVVVKVKLGPSGEEWGVKTHAVVLSSCLAKEFSVRVEHLRRSKERPTPQDTIGEFTVGQLVQVVGRDVGVIIRLEVGERAQVLMVDGQKMQAKFGQLEPVPLPSAVQYQRQVWAPDRNNHPVRPGYIVKAPQTIKRAEPIKAEVKYIHGEAVFLEACEARVGERAYIVCSSRKCEFAYSLQRAPRNKVEVEKPITAGQISYGVTMASETSWLRPYAKRMLNMDDAEALNQGSGVRIVGGSYKGLRGEVRANQGDFILVSLLCKPKLVSVPADCIRTDEFYEKRTKQQRWPNSMVAPQTPKYLPDSAPSTPISSSGAPPSQSGDSDRLPNDDDAWNPTYLMEGSEAGDAQKSPLPLDVVAAQDKPASAPATPRLGDTNPSSAPATPSGGRKRAPRFPAYVTASPARPAAQEIQEDKNLWDSSPSSLDESKAVPNAVGAPP